MHDSVSPPLITCALMLHRPPGQRFNPGVPPIKPQQPLLARFLYVADVTTRKFRCRGRLDWHTAPAAMRSPRLSSNACARCVSALAISRSDDHGIVPLLHLSISPQRILSYALFGCIKNGQARFLACDVRALRHESRSARTAKWLKIGTSGLCGRPRLHPCNVFCQFNPKKSRRYGRIGRITAVVSCGKFAASIWRHIVRYLLSGRWHECIKVYQRTQLF